MKVHIEISIAAKTIGFDFEGKRVVFNFDMFQHIYGDSWDMYSFQEWKDLLRASGANMVDSIAIKCNIEADIFEITYNIQ